MSITQAVSSFFVQPVRTIQGYRLSNLRPDVVAGLTVAVVLLPQAIAYALIAELPPQVGLYAAITAAMVGALWGSSNHLQTGPTNAASLLVLSILVPIAAPGSPEFMVAAGLMAVLVGVFRLALGLARLGMLVNFVSDSVIVGFTAGAGVLISINQLRQLLRLDFPSSPALIDTIQNLFSHLSETHWPSLLLGLGTILLILLLRRLNPKLPGPLFGMVAAAVAVGLLRLNQQGVTVIGQLPRSLPPLARLPLFNLELIGQLSTGAMAVAAIGLVEAMSIARSIASQTGQQLDTNQELVGQGLANIASGFFSGYPCSGSFTRSAVNYNAGAQTPLASLFSGLFVLMAMIVLAPLAAYVPRTALAGVLILTAYRMIDRVEMARIWRGAREDAATMIVTFLATLFLHLEFAVLAGILFSLAVYIMKASVPQVASVVPDDSFGHFTHQPQKPQCPQLAVIDILGDLYFGAVSHVEDAIWQHLSRYPSQRFLLLRMHSVHQCDVSGIDVLENIVRTLRVQGGDVFTVRARGPVLDIMNSTDFKDCLGSDHFLSEDEAIGYLFHRILDPAICIYECEVRVFKECQNLPKRTYPVEIPLHTDIPTGSVASVSPRELWQQLRDATPPLAIDVREPREFKRGHVPQAQLIPLSRLPSDASALPRDRPIIVVCRSGRRSTRAAYLLHSKGYDNVAVLRGGMLAWETAGLLEAVDLNV
jgi:SulP family sulfate permease